MDQPYKYADLENDRKMLDKITVLEEELTRQTGRKVVLIAVVD